jgi:anti-sigma regulatory factor (Ser/Thr protein kinase)
MSGGAGQRPSFRHELLLHRDDDELLAVVVPFVLDGLAAGEPVFVGGGERCAGLLRAHLGPDRDVTWLRPPGEHTARAIADLLNQFAYLADNGVDAIRVVGQVPTVDHRGEPWRPWPTFESVLNHAAAELPVWGICPVDLRVTPADAAEAACRAHPRLTGPGGSRANPDYVEPGRFLRELPSAPPDPIEASPPTIELHDVTRAHCVRAAVRELGASLFEADPLEDLIVAVGEVTSNAIGHGIAPVSVRLWATTGRLVVAVTDRGSGPHDPAVGFLPPRPLREGGYGLWIARQYCDRLDISTGPQGCTVRMVAYASALPVTC